MPDVEVEKLIRLERHRQSVTLRLIASENDASTSVLAALASPFENKSCEGYPGARFHEGQEFADELETLAIRRAESLFGMEHANVQPYSGSSANFAVLAAFLKPGETLMGMDLGSGGHLTHGSPASYSGQWYRTVAYGVRSDTETVDLDQVRSLAVKERPKLLICGGSSLPRAIDFEAFSRIAREVGAICVADIAHVAGLVAGGAHTSPAPFADVVTTTTHKTLRGPRGAIIMCREQHSRRIDRAVFPGLQGAAHASTTAAIAIALHEAHQPSFRQYAHSIVANARCLAEELMTRGLRLVSGGTDTHLILIDVRKLGMTGREAARSLSQAGIEANANPIPLDPRRPDQWSGIRIGTAAITTRGLSQADMPLVADWIVRAISAGSRGDAQEAPRIASEVADRLGTYPTETP